MKEKPVKTHFLLVDIGNTNTHVGLSSGKKIICDTEFPTHSDFTGKLRRFIGSHKLLRRAVVASVVPRRNAFLKRCLRECGISDVHFVGPDSPLAIGIDYPKPETIGPDRLVNAEGAVARYGAPAVVIDFGTAVTFDIVDSKKRYIGGVIAPGLAAMTDYLYQRTALLPKISLSEPRRPVGKNTVEAMRIGAVIGYRGMIKDILTQILNRSDMKKASVVATGGYSRLIARKIPQIARVNPMLTLQGLEQIAINLG